MHGRPREWKHKAKDPKVAEARKKKVETIRQATAAVLDCCKNDRFDDAAIIAAGKLLAVVPEIYTVWNYRRRALQSAFDQGGQAAEKATQSELLLTQRCLLENPKSYSAWHHRKWVVGKGHADLDKEIALVTRALQQDSRNFHAWGYRQFIVKAMGREAEEELAYSEELIVDNFSNYSAWHYRTVMLPKVYCPEASPSGQPLLPVEVLDEEYDMVHQAFATDTKDQSPWMYYRWLLGCSIAHAEAARNTPSDPEATAILSSVLEREVDRFQEEHLSVEPDAKWPLLTVARLKEAQARLGLSQGSKEEALAEVAGIYRRLMALDPLRMGFYEDALQGKARVVAQPGVVGAVIA